MKWFKWSQWTEYGLIENETAELAAAAVEIRALQHIGQITLTAV